MGDEGQGLRIKALDGVRGLALVAILAYHADPSWLPGAPLAVTVFFTLSGFLITSLLIREHERTGRVDLRSFWIRRARRLVPGSIAAVVLIAVLVPLGLRDTTSGLVGDAVSALTWTANWRFVVNGDTYTSLFRDPSPFQHFWSLAVEEQLYVVLPLVAALALGRRGRPRLRFGALVVLGIGASTWAVLTAHASGGAGGHAYYGTDARVAEPLVGVLLALLVTRHDGFVRLGRAGTRVVGAAGVAALGGLALLMTELSVDDPRLYRGGFLLGAVLAAVVVLASTQPTLLGRALAAPPLVGLGLISYAVYLFHWPIFGWIDPDGTAEPARVAAEVGLTLALAIISTTLLEQPIRRRRVASLRVFTASWANASVAAIAVVVVATTIAVPGELTQVDLGLGVEDAVPPPPPAAPAAPGQQALAAAPAAAAPVAAPAAPSGDAPTATTLPPEPVTPEEAEILTGRDAWAEGDVEEPPSGDDQQVRVAVIGDSLAHNIATGLAAWAETRTDVVVYDLSLSFCPLSRGGERRWEDNESFDVHPGCSWWDDPYSERSLNLAAFAPDVVVNQSAISEMLDRRLWHWDDWLRPGDRQYHRWLLEEYDAMFGALQSIAGTATRSLTLNAPCGDFSRARGWRRVSGPDVRIIELNDNVYPLMARSAAGNLFEQLCPQGYYTDDLWGIEDARPDGVHLTDEAATELARRWLGPLVLDVAMMPAPVDILGTPPEAGASAASAKRS